MYNQTVLSFINKSQKQHFIQQMQNNNPTPQKQHFIQQMQNNNPTLRIKTTTAIYTAISYVKCIQQ